MTGRIINLSFSIFLTCLLVSGCTGEDMGSGDNKAVEFGTGNGEYSFHVVRLNNND